MRVRSETAGELASGPSALHSGDMKKPNPIPALVLASALALGVAGCSDDATDVPSAPTFTQPGQSTETPPVEEPTATDDATEDATTDASPTETGAAPTDDDTTSPADGDVDGVTAAALAAIDLAEQETGGVAYELDDEDGGTWDIDIAVGDQDIEVLVSADGTEVLRTRDDGRVSANDLARLEVATVTIQEAIRIAVAEVSRPVEAVDLETENGVVVWEVDLEGDDVEVYVDVTTGAVVRVEGL